MKFEIYCDESHPDLFWSNSERRAKFLLIGGLWLPADQRSEVKKGIYGLKEKYGFRQEIKWHRVHAGREEFYRELINLFVGFGDSLRFRCIVVEADKVDMVHFHDNDRELGFYKFYYQLIKHWIFDFNEYKVFCDEKTNRKGDRLATLRRTLDYANISSRVASVQALPSEQLVLLQLADFLLGIVSSRMNESASPGSVKDRLAHHLEERLGIPHLGPTRKYELKFNIFKIDLQGGW